ncbi:LOW QUALITY PROTEIN: hypothetical protein Cgig2_008331 [Carnegiea gigantea]|uniref:Uncharacterized protein n=1 Tax=Carnegiea gigantea TaxID=171969 RepID=A0A9Q1K6F3_9CARY|nr:LOW QUALITY PROTEIN: hypothetical protein Cgig2_008331 [Carnegiea gigantea]
MRKYLQESLPDHTLLLSIPKSPTANIGFKLWDMWDDDPHFKNIITQHVNQGLLNVTTYRIFEEAKKPLQKLKRDRNVDIHAQQYIYREQLTMIRKQFQANPMNESHAAGKGIVTRIGQSLGTLYKNFSCQSETMNAGQIYVLSVCAQGHKIEGFDEVADSKSKSCRAPIEAEAMSKGPTLSTEL